MVLRWRSSVLLILRAFLLDSISRTLNIAQSIRSLVLIRLFLWGIWPDGIRCWVSSCEISDFSFWLGIRFRHIPRISIHESITLWVLSNISMREIIKHVFGLVYHVAIQCLQFLVLWREHPHESWANMLIPGVSIFLKLPTELISLLFGHSGIFVLTSIELVTPFPLGFSFPLLI